MTLHFDTVGRGGNIPFAAIAFRTDSLSCNLVMLFPHVARRSEFVFKRIPVDIIMFEYMNGHVYLVGNKSRLAAK